MADTSPIEWTDATWNPVVGCSIVSPGCTNCYAMGMAYRIERMTAALAAQGKPGAPHYDGTTKRVKGKARGGEAEGRTGTGKPIWTGKLALAPDAIVTAPLRWKRPRRIFVNSMGDLFHEDVPDAWIDRVFAVMALSPQHTFQVLTKRSARMREYINDWWSRRRIYEQVCDIVVADQMPVILMAPGIADPGLKPAWPRVHLDRWPLPNVWLGVSAERQQEADERIPDLLATPAAIRFASLEPLLGPIDLVSVVGGTQWIGGQRGHDGQNQHSGRAGEVIHGRLHTTDPRQLHHHHDERCERGLDWVIIGGESGPDARPMHPHWARFLRDQCAAASVPFFFKQWGSWADFTDTEPKPVCSEDRIFTPAGEVIGVGVDYGRNGMVDPHWRERGAAWMGRANKAYAGRLLDGVNHNAMPERAP